MKRLRAIASRVQARQQLTPSERASLEIAVLDLERILAAWAVDGEEQWITTRERWFLRRQWPTLAAALDAAAHHQREETR